MNAEHTNEYQAEFSDDLRKEDEIAEFETAKSEDMTEEQVAYDLAKLRGEEV